MIAQRTIGPRQSESFEFVVTETQLEIYVAGQAQPFVVKPGRSVALRVKVNHDGVAMVIIERLPFPVEAA